MGGRSARPMAGVWSTVRTTTPTSHEVPAGEKKGSVRRLTPSMWMMAVAVPMWVMARGAPKLTLGAMVGCCWWCGLRGVKWVRRDVRGGM